MRLPNDDHQLADIPLKALLARLHLGTDHQSGRGSIHHRQSSTRARPPTHNSSRFSGLLLGVSHHQRESRAVAA